MGRIAFGDSPRPEFGRRPGHEAAGPPPLTGTAAAHRNRAVRLASELCPDLPAPGEHVHCLMLGFFDLCSVVLDVCRRTRPRRLRIATLAWSKPNLLALLDLMESRRADPLPITLLASDYFHSHDAELVEWARGFCGDLPLTLVGARSHAKVVTFDLGPGDGLVMEGSANLRSNRNREQLTIIRDRQTHDWHAAWIDQLADGAPS